MNQQPVGTTWPTTYCDDCGTPTHEPTTGWALCNECTQTNTAA